MKKSKIVTRDEAFDISKKYTHIVLTQVSEINHDFVFLKDGSKIPTKSCHAIGYLPQIRGIYQWEIIAPKKYLKKITPPTQENPPKLRFRGVFINQKSLNLISG